MSALPTVPTPECDRMLAVAKESQAVGSFIDWMRGEGWGFGRVHDEGTHDPYWEWDPRSIEQMLADFYQIDLTKVEQERRAILAALGGDPWRTA